MRTAAEPRGNETLAIGGEGSGHRLAASRQDRRPRGAKAFAGTTLAGSGHSQIQAGTYASTPGNHIPRVR